MNSKTVVVIPTYNEAECIEEIISQIICFQPEFDILVVDDKSPDGTGRLVQELSKKNNRVMLLSMPKKAGLGRAYIAGFKYVLSQYPPYERVIQMDADFSHHPRYLNGLIAAARDTDISIGSRYIPKGKVLEWGLYRRILSYAANLYTRFWLKLKVKDCTSGFRCFRGEVLKKLKFETIKSNGYMFQIELLTCCIRMGCSFSEIPITFVERKKGKTKLGFFEVWEAIWKVIGS